MITKGILIGILGCTSSLTALDMSPWLGDVYGCSFESSLAYVHFSKVDGAQVQLTGAERSRCITCDLGATPLSHFDFQIEGESCQTNRTNWALRSAAVQCRLNLLNDIEGDPCSLVLGINVRGAPTHFLKDISTPYAAQCNVELTTSIGKEFSNGPHWLLRTYGFLAVGQANRGSPWIRPIWVGEYQWNHLHQWTLFAKSAMGYGNTREVDIHSFLGWSDVQHRSVDIGAGYGLKMGVWGHLSVYYSRRVFAQHCPTEVNHFMASYSLPFSVL